MRNWVERLVRCGIPERTAQKVVDFFFKHRRTVELIAVCVMAIIIVFIFTTNQTKREKMWQETIKEVVSQITTAEVDNGQQNGHP